MRQLVSILIPCHNAAPYVAAGIESALAQTWAEKEIIVVNDGSTDGSTAILERFVDRGVKVFHHPFGSAAAARNKAFQESSGNFIKFFDADDVLMPRTIELQMSRLNGTSTAVASAEWGRFYQNDISTLRLSPENVWRDLNALDWLVEAWMDARPMMQPGIYLIPRRVLDRAGVWDERLSLTDDFEFFSRVLTHSERVLFAAGARLCYRSGLPCSLSSNKDRKAVESAFGSLILGTGHLLNHRRDPAARRACANLMQDFIYTYYPEHSDLRGEIARRIRLLGGADLQPDGSPKFHLLRKLTGWKIARRIEKAVRV